jgi:hypothetical protein
VNVTSRGGSSAGKPIVTVPTLDLKYNPRPVVTQPYSRQQSIESGVYKPLNTLPSTEGPVTTRTNVITQPQMQPPPVTRRYIPQTERKYVNPPRPNTPTQYPQTARKVGISPQPQVIRRNYTPLRADNPYNQPYNRSNSRNPSVGSHRGSYRVI